MRRSQLFPLPVSSSEIDVLGPSLFGYKGTQEPVHNADNQGTQYSGPEAVNLKTPDHPGGHLEKQGIDDKGEEPEGEDIERQGEHYEDGTEEGIQYSQDRCCEKCAQEASHLYPADQIGSNHDGGSQDQPPDKDPFHHVSPPVGEASCSQDARMAPVSYLFKRT